MTQYQNKLNALCDFASEHPNSSGSRAIRGVIDGLESGPISDLLFETDGTRFNDLIDLLVEFRNTGRSLNFNSIHRAARERLQNAMG